MLNIAGPAYDFGNVLFAVLQECEHRGGRLLPNEAEGRLLETARASSRRSGESYEENGGTPGYWQELEREVLETAMPQYIPAAVEQTRLEKTGYDVWRAAIRRRAAPSRSSAWSSAALIIAAPFIPILEDAFAFVLAVAGLLYPEIRQLFVDFRHSRLLNRLIAQAEKYQKNSRIHYMSEAQLEEELERAGAGGEPAEPGRKTAAGDRGCGRAAAQGAGPAIVSPLPVPGPRDHAGVDPADAHRQLAGRARRERRRAWSKTKRVVDARRSAG